MKSPLVLAASVVTKKQDHMQAQREQTQPDVPNNALADCFDLTITTFILLNAIFIGVQTDYMARNSHDVVPEVFRVCEMFFCAVFVAEISVRISQQRRAFLVSQGWRWNVFDLTLVVLQVVEVTGMIVT